LLDVETVMEGSKIVRNSTALLHENGIPLSGYEIHMGRPIGPGALRPMALIDGRPDGAVSADGRVMGSYLHGIFGSDAYRAHLLGQLGAEAGGMSYRLRVEEALDELAARIEECLDVDALLATAADVTPARIVG
jgi:adenosylcobyric acid synthase